MREKVKCMSKKQIKEFVQTNFRSMKCKYEVGKVIDMPLALLICYYAGMRRSECATLTVQNFSHEPELNDAGEEVMTVYFKGLKGSHPRTVMFPKELTFYIVKQLAHCHEIGRKEFFRFKTGHGLADNFRRNRPRGFFGGIHSLRHTRFTQLVVDKGIPVHDAIVWTGHKSADSLLTYIKKESVDKINNQMAKVAY